MRDIVDEAKYNNWISFPKAIGKVDDGFVEIRIENAFLDSLCSNYRVVVRRNDIEKHKGFTTLFFAKIYFMKLVRRYDLSIFYEKHLNEIVEVEEVKKLKLW